MQSITIDEEFKSLLPALDKDTYALLEENIIENGCRDSLVLWNGILIDGHNRYEICSKHNIPFNTVNKEFGSREEVLIWIISTQVSRRNLTPIQLSHFRGLHYRAERQIVKNIGGKNQFSERVEVSPQNGDKPKNQRTVERLAQQYKVSKNTIERDTKVAESIDAIGEISPEAKRMILSGEAKIDKKELEAMSSMSRDEISAVALEIEEGRYEKRKPAAAAVDGADSAPGSPQPAGTGGYGSATSSPNPAAGADTRPAKAIISNIMDGFSSDLRNPEKTDNAAALKTALRSFIDTLEDVYTRL